MSCGQQYCLKWNNHTNNMVKVFNQLLDDQNFCDVTLAVEGTHLKAHKMVLSACSTYFKDLFVANPCKHPIVILKDMRLDDLKAIINFMYSGEVNVSQSQLGALLKTAEVLKVKGLTEVNDKQTDSLSVPNTSPTNKVSNESPSQQTTVSTACLSRNKRRRRGNHTNNASISGESDQNSSQSEDSADETSNKKPKDSSPVIDTSSRSSKDSRSLLSETNPITKTTITKSDAQNVIQTRRRQTLQLLESETNRDLQSLQNLQNESLNDCEQPVVNNGNQSESWQSGVEQSTALALPPNETEDDSEDMFDVKPIITFDETSTPVSNAMVLREDSSSMMSNPNDSNSLAGPSSAQTGNIRTSLRSFGFQPMYTTDSRSECPFCHKKIVNMRRHINEVHVGVLYQCQICCRKFKRKDKLNHHLITEHSI